jgi:hypothetical protein
MIVATASVATLVGAGAATASANGSTSVAPPGATVVARLLNNPRQLSLLEGDKRLLVAEAGRGGKTCFAGGEKSVETFVGATGSISSVKLDGSGTYRRIVRGLLSAAGPDGSFAVGSDGVSARRLSDIFNQETYFPPVASGLKGLNKQNGATLRLKDGNLFKFADISAYEQAHDPDNQGFDSDPYSVLALYKHTLVTDAAGNDVLSLDAKGNVSVFAVLPNITDGACAGQPNDNGTTGCDAVPTSLAKGPNGTIFVGGLGGEAPGSGRVWQFDSAGNLLKTYDGLTTVTGVVVAKDGTIYASELFGGDPNAQVPGQVTKISPDGTRKSVALPFPAGLALDTHNRLYVSVFSTAPAGGLGVPGIDTSGQVWRLRV